MNASLAVTKQDVEEIVGRVVGEIVGDAMQLISKEFNKHRVILDDLQTLAIRADTKLSDLKEGEDLQDAQIRLIQRKLA